MDGFVVLLLLAAVAVWLFGRISKKLRIRVSGKRYAIVATIAVIGVLMLYANAQ